MSDVLSRPTLRRYDARQPSSVPLRQALLRALVAALVGYVVVAAIVLAAWGTDSRSAVSTLAAMRSIGSVWAFAHRTPLHVGSGSTALHLGLTPLGLLALPVALLAHGGVRLGRAVREVAGERARLRAAAELLATFVATYALLAGLIVASTSTSALHVARFSVIGWAALAALVAGGIGLGTAARLWPALTGYRLPAQVPVALRGAGAALAVVLSAGALLVAAALALATGRAADLAHGLGTGIPGGFLLAVLCVLYAPSAAVYASAYAVGTGFVIGSGTSVAASGAHVGVVPSFPLLAALPRGEHASAASTLVWAAPVVGGLLAGVIIARAGATGLRAVATALGSGLGAGLALAVLCALAGGSLGSGALATVGPAVIRTGCYAAAEVAGSALVVALIALGMRRYRS